MFLGAGTTFQNGAAGVGGSPNGIAGQAVEVLGSTTGAVVQPDCNGNGILDSIDIADGSVMDVDCNGVPDTCECVVDLTGEGDLNFFDITAYILAFNTQEPVGDFNGDGLYNFFDIADYLTAFQAGCP